MEDERAGDEERMNARTNERIGARKRRTWSGDKEGVEWMGEVKQYIRITRITNKVIWNEYGQHNKRGCPLTDRTDGGRRME